MKLRLGIIYTKEQRVLLDVGTSETLTEDEYYNILLTALTALKEKDQAMLVNLTFSAIEVCAEDEHLFKGITKAVHLIQKGENISIQFDNPN